ncbi:MAG: SMC-Scp complex subunit ScpB [Planctomycetaceae bacterium]
MISTPATASIKRTTDALSAGAWRWCFFRLVRQADDRELFGSGTTPFRRTPKMARVEAALLVADGALSSRKLAHLAMLADAGEAGTLIDQLNVAYDQTRSAFRIERVAAGYQMLTRPKFAPWLDKLHQRQARLKLSAPAMETLTIIAYRQPITRADIEAVRGVASAEMLKQLMERSLIRITGEDDSLGRPYLYGTTRQFLELFGLRSAADLPLAEQLSADKVSAAEAGAADGEADDPSESDRLAAEALDFAA